MRPRQHRCEHCNVRFFEPQRYCGPCQNAIKEALAPVPRKFERIKVEVSDPPLETVKAWYEAQEAARLEKHASGANPYIKRILVNMYDLNDPSNKNVREVVFGEGSHKGNTYHMDYWTKREGGTVHLDAEKNLETGEIKPWRNYDN